MPAVPELPVGAQRPEERLLERVLGRVTPEQAREVAEDLVLPLLVEALERWYRCHGFHHP